MSVPSDRRAVTVDVLRVFCDSREEHGNPLGVVLDGAAIPDAGDRQELAAELGYSETVFVDDAETGELRIYTPKQELALAGHPLVGTAWLLGDRGALPPQLLPPAGPVSCGRTAQGAWVEADPAAAPYWEVRELAERDEVDALDPSSFGDDAHAYLWCWLDEPAGRVRARAFASGKGVVEDEATGSAAMVLGALTGRILTIEQGRGSVIQVVPGATGLVRIGGRVVVDEQFTVGL